MKSLHICDIRPEPTLHDPAARILYRAFAALGNPTWPTVESARAELDDCLTEGFICLGAIMDGELVAWGGMRPMYGWQTCELHPLVVDPARQGTGVGRALLAALEAAARERGAAGVLLGSDDQTGSTDAADRRSPAAIAAAIRKGIRQLPGRPMHPAAFYRSAGYQLVGLVPDANGPGMPDILFWKSLED